MVPLSSSTTFTHHPTTVCTHTHTIRHQDKHEHSRSCHLTCPNSVSPQPTIALFPLPLLTHGYYSLDQNLPKGGSWFYCTTTRVVVSTFSECILAPPYPHQYHIPQLLHPSTSTHMSLRPRQRVLITQVVG